ncbi:hypothetical protein [Pelagovum pacificum]|uniref:Uncharacterized protein n=1 Tax=Pelagovum pacificum TaxID=2588711 RepID=A0A5C5G8Y8_9RHOB|nr:hypothetical protein [Pelagovum pacificum]QQA45101.1 hypothetical protein I8N54_20095 [Pelagovum pacificum]TNY30458.1 hypothetical protein FHY64_20045 [Pelagovum pacificum]
MLVEYPRDKLTLDLESDNPKVTYEVTSYLLTLETTPYHSSVDTTQIFVENEIVRDFTLSLREGKLGEHSVYDLGTFEIVNAHQWDGRQPNALVGKGPSRTRILEEPPLFHIAAVNVATGERVVAVRTHCEKDQVFTVMNRLNAMLDYTRRVCAPWQDLIQNDELIPVDEIRDALQDMPPRFKFSPLPERELSEKAATLVRKYVRSHVITTEINKAAAAQEAKTAAMATTRNEKERAKEEARQQSVERIAESGPRWRPAIIVVVLFGVFLILLNL